MDRRSLENMKLDRRLIGRRGWIDEGELQQQLDALPDVSAKVATGDEDADSSEDSIAQSADTDALTTPTAEPAGDVGSTATIATDTPDLSGPTGSDSPLT